MSYWPLFPYPYGPPLAVYIVLQVVALFRLSGKWRLAVALPIPVMIIVMVWTANAYEQGSNLWPIGAIFVNAAALLYVIFLWIAARSKKPETRLVFILLAALFPLSIFLTLGGAAIVLIICGLLYYRHMTKKENA